MLAGPRASETALGALAEQVIAQDQAHHRLDDRHRARQDAGIVASLRLEHRLLALLGDGRLLAQDGRGRLEGDPQRDRLAVRDAALDAARAVGPGPDATALVCVEEIVVARA